MNALRVLLVDDMDDDRALALRVLRKVWPDVEVREARDGREAIELLEAIGDVDRPDIILLDINMPRMNGLEFLETWYAQRGMDIPVVAMLTSSGQASDRESVGRFACVGDYVVKPLDRASVARFPALVAARTPDVASRPASTPVVREEAPRAPARERRAGLTVTSAPDAPASSSPAARR